MQHDAWCEDATAAERAQMRASTFLEPRLRVLEETTTRGDTASRALLFVLFSPESAHVYFFDGSYDAPVEEMHRNGLRSRDDFVDLERKKTAALGPWLRSLGVASVRVSVADACVIPDSLAGRRWRALVPNSSGSRLQAAEI